MNVTLNYLRGRRTWLIPDFVVYYSFPSCFLLYTEMGQTSAQATPEESETFKRVVLMKADLKCLAQMVSFSDLYDFKGNRLPELIKNPKVLLLRKNEVRCFVVGAETDAGFRIAKFSGFEKTGLVDLMIVEMG